VNKIIIIIIFFWNWQNLPAVALFRDTLLRVMVAGMIGVVGVGWLLLPALRTMMMMMMAVMDIIIIIIIIIIIVVVVVTLPTAVVSQIMTSSNSTYTATAHTTTNAITTFHVRGRGKDFRVAQIIRSGRRVWRARGQRCARHAKCRRRLRRYPRPGRVVAALAGNRGGVGASTRKSLRACVWM
jgi:hypothetical protein